MTRAITVPKMVKKPTWLELGVGVGVSVRVGLSLTLTLTRPEMVE